MKRIFVLIGLLTVFTVHWTAFADELSPFGASLFSGQAGVQKENVSNPNYTINPGDRVALHVWGPKTFEEILTVDTQGNVFVPEIGPLKVAGLKNSELDSRVRQHVRGTFTDKVETYTSLAIAQPIGVFVTGHIIKPGHYPGGPGDSLIDFLNKAGGIDPKAGSYRNVKVLRKGKKIASVDLYRFLLEGDMPSLVFQDEDTIVVERKGPSVQVSGSVKNNAAFESKLEATSGRDILGFAGPLSGTSHVSVTGNRSKEPFNAYLTIEEFYTLQVRDGDVMIFFADAKADSIQVKVGGCTTGQSQFAVKRDTTLRALLQNVSVDRNLADLQSLYIKRKSVVERQKKAINDALVQLEKVVLTAPAVTEGEASIRVKEAEMVGQFITRIKAVEPDGRLVVTRDSNVADIYLEDGDEIIIPQKSNIVVIAGEVLMPQAITSSPGMGVQDYVKASGGFTPRADKSNFVIIRPNGEAVYGKNPAVGPGDQILVLPRIETKNVQIASTIMQILYQIAVAARVAVAL